MDNAEVRPSRIIDRTFIKTMNEGEISIVISIIAYGRNIFFVKELVSFFKGQD